MNVQNTSLPLWRHNDSSQETGQNNELRVERSDVCEDGIAKGAIRIVFFASDSDRRDAGAARYVETTRTGFRADDDADSRVEPAIPATLDQVAKRSPTTGNEHRQYRRRSVLGFGHEPVHSSPGVYRNGAILTGPWSISGRRIRCPLPYLPAVADTKEPIRRSSAMHSDETTVPVAPHQPVDSQPALPNFLLGRTLDKTVESQRRRLLAVSIPKALTRDDISRADEALDQLSLTFFAAPNESLANAFGAALKSVKRPTKAALIAGESSGLDGGLVAAALDGQRLVVSAAGPGLIVVQQGDQLFSFPREAEAGDEFLDPSATIFETRLDPGDIVALLSGGSIAGRSQQSRLTRAEIAEIAGPQGAWVWIELEKAKAQDSRHRAGLLSAPEPEAQRTWSTTAAPADPLWARTKRVDGAMFQKPPALDSLNRYRSASGDSFARSARTRLPRGRPAAWMLAGILLALLLAGSGFAYLYSNRPQTAVLPDPEIAQHTAALAAALASSDPAAIEAALPAAERALAIGIQSDLPPEQLAVLETEILQGHDRIEGVLRLNDLTLVGRVPESLQARDPQLGEAAGVLFLLDPTAYQVNLSNMTMLEMPFLPTRRSEHSARKPQPTTWPVSLPAMEAAWCSWRSMARPTKLESQPGRTESIRPLG